jgi:hypothetical protein
VRAVVDSELLSPRPPGGFPPLAGILAAVGRPEARVLLVAGDEGRPLLAFANRGLGHVAAWSADLAGPWGERWRAAPAFPAWVAQWVRAIEPPLPSPAAPALARGTRVAPSAPAPSEVARLERLCAGAVAPLSQLALPPASTRAVERALNVDLALCAVMVLLLLACVERGAAARAL